MSGPWFTAAACLSLFLVIVVLSVLLTIVRTLP